MVAVAIVAILAGTALPAYTDYVRRGQLPDAFSALADYRVKMEQYYQDRRNYGTAACTDEATLRIWVLAIQALTLGSSAWVSITRMLIVTINSISVRPWAVWGRMVSIRCRGPASRSWSPSCP